MRQRVIHLERAAVARARREREDRIRAAQQRAFDDALGSTDADRRSALRAAVDVFLDACEGSGAISA